LTDEDSRKQQANAQFRKAQQAADGKKAMAEYEAEAAALRSRTAKLRELRLARDAAAASAAPAAAPPVKKAAKKKAKGPSGSLASWLKDREDSGHNN
jgi:hypothetical protein